MRYPAAKGLFASVSIWGVIFILVLSAFFIPGEQLWIFAIGGGVVVLLLLWIWFSAWYEFRDDHLFARMGPFFQRIPYDKITSARKASTIASSMSLSSEAIELRHGKNYITGTTYISPRDRDRFLIELKARCHNLSDDVSG